MKINKQNKISKPNKVSESNKVSHQKNESLLLKGKKIVKLLNEKSFWIASLVFLIPFILRRLPFYLYTPTLRPFNAEGDVWGYFDVANQMSLGIAPHTEIRPIGYPLFLKLTWLFSETHLATVVGQSLFTMLACLLLIYGFYKNFKGYSVFAALALVFYVNSSTNMWYECSNMSECVFICSLLTFLGIFLLAIQSQKKWIWILLGFSAWYVMAVRPNGAFACLIPIPLLIYHYAKKISFKLPIITSSIIVTLMLAVFTYNYFNAGIFGVSIYSYYTNLGVAFESNTLKTSPKYEPFINTVIDSCKTKGGYYDNLYNFLSFSTQTSFAKEKIKEHSLDDNRYTINRYLMPYIKQITDDALSFDARSKFTLNHLKGYFGDMYSKMNVYNYGTPFESDLKFRIQARYLSLSTASTPSKDITANLGWWSFHTPLYEKMLNTQQNYQQKMFKELYYLNYPKFPDYVKVVDNQIVIDLEENWIVHTSYKFNELIAKFAFFTAEGFLMSILLGISLVFSIVVIFVTKFKSKTAFIALVFSSMYVIQGIIVSSTAIFERRYWYVLFFTTYFSVIFLVLLSLELRKYLKTKQVKF